VKKRWIGLAAALAVFAGPAAAQPPSAPPLPFVLKQLAPGVYAAIDGPDHKAGSNAGFVIGDDGCWWSTPSSTSRPPARSSPRSTG
jgi:hypothetical protein